ncbi:CG6149 [Drosophila busckii]|uniref:CG6149 n=1 Tax=Drosophila busckii TaxID=30019 RepID=A0A0M3QW82_DROBS|nr:androgen-induced gene 1 protein [Drosophila busckii]ALC43699.1 CG6149 [Drosophila busckii]
MMLQQQRQQQQPLRRNLCLHLLALGHLGYATYYDYKYAQLPLLAVELRLEPTMGYKFNYLTFLNGLLQSSYYLLAVACDLLPARALSRWRDFLLASLVVPLALTVSITFWLLYALPSYVIYPQLLQQIYPRWLNHSLHSFVVLYALLELCLTPHRYPRRREGFMCLGLSLAGYLLWLHVVHHHTHIWAYPFLHAFSTPLLYCFFAFIVGAAFGYYALGELLSAAAWPTDELADWK